MHLKISTLLLLIFQLSILSAQERPPKAIGKLGFDLPIVDLNERSDLQTIVDQEAGQYLGHPTTLLLDDQKTIIAVYPKGHGRGPIVMKRSTDGGQSWSGRLPTPSNWETSLEVPTIYQTMDAQGKKRLLLFSGTQDHVGGAIRMATSDDDGKNWTELQAIGNYKGIVAMADCVPLSTPGHYLATFHKRGPDNSMILYQVQSTNGGVTWGTPIEIYKSSKIHLCEGGIIKSPDGKEMAMLLRENSRNYNSQIIFSQDEGKTWSPPRPLPGALNGDRHQGIYLPDGRLFLQFRDHTPIHRPGNIYSPTEGDWVGWVGTYEDLKEGYEGQYRIRFKDNKKSRDTTYPAAELLPDGTLVCTTYGHWEKGESPYILSFRFKIAELDKIAEKLPYNVRLFIANDMTGLN